MILVLCKKKKTFLFPPLSLGSPAQLSFTSSSFFSFSLLWLKIVALGGSMGGGPQLRLINSDQLGLIASLATANDGCTAWPFWGFWPFRIRQLSDPLCIYYFIVHQYTLLQHFSLNTPYPHVGSSPPCFPKCISKL